MLIPKRENKPLSFYLILSLSLILGLLPACAEDKTDGLTTIEVPKASHGPFDLVDLAESVRLVQLEMTEGSLLNMIQDVKLFDDKLYVSDMAGQILVFDIAGKFLNVLGKHGHGPGEYTYISSLAVDKSAGLIHIASGRKLLTYSANNLFVAEGQLPLFIDYLDVHEGTLFAVAQLDGIETENGYVNQTTLLEISPSLEVADSIPVRRVALKEQTAASYPFKHYISNMGQERYLYSPVLVNEEILRDTLYRIDGKTLTPFTKISFQKNHLNEKNVKTIWIKNMINSQSYLVCEYDSEGENMLFLFDKASSRHYNLKDGILDGEGNPVFLRPLDLANDVFYYISSAAYSAGMTEEPNPVIGIVRLK